MNKKCVHFGKMYLTPFSRVLGITVHDTGVLNFGYSKFGMS